MSRSLLHLAALALLGGASAGYARADGPTALLGVSEPPGPSAGLIEISRQVRQALAERSPGILDAAQTRDRMVAPDVTARLAELDRAYDEARTAYQNGDFAGSIRSFRAVATRLSALPPGRDVFAAWTRAMLRLAKAESDLGHADEAQAVIDELVRAAPSVSVDPEAYPPRFIRLVEDTKARVAALPAGKLSVHSTLPATRVYVNGRDVGETPVTLDLAPGTYRVAGSSGALRSATVTVDVGASARDVSLDFAAAEALRPSLGPGLAVPDPADSRALAAAGALLGLDTLLAVGFDRGVFVVGRVVDVQQGTLVREGRVRLLNQALPLGGATALAEFLASGGTASGLVLLPGEEGAVVDLSTPPLRPAPDGLPGSAPRKDGSKVLGWTAFGTGIATVALAGVSLWQLLASNSSYSSASAMLDASGALPPGADVAAYQSLISQGDTQRKVATITGVGAGACLIATGILGYLAVKQTGEIGPFRF